MRPRRMLDAFRQLGYDVVEVTGYTPERVPVMRRLARDIAAGRRFEFCYSESVTSPTALSDPRHLPLHPFADPAFFRALRRAGIPSGLFYRDVYWRFDAYREDVPLHKRAVAVPFYRFDLGWYERCLGIVYLPSLGMADAIPRCARLRVEELPPGTDLHGGELRLRDETDELRLLYVGSVTPPIYDVSPLLRAVDASDRVKLTLCCPESEGGVLASYGPRLLQHVDVHHVSGDALGALYEDSDVACIVMGPHPYRDFAMPVKLFEAIGRLTPSIANADTAAGRFVARNEVGWIFDDESDLKHLLDRLADHPALLGTKHSTLREVAPCNTWEARAETVARDMEDLGRGR